VTRWKSYGGPSFQDIFPWVDRNWPGTVLCRVVIYPDRVRGGWYPAVELAYRTPGGRVLTARRFGDTALARRDEHIMSALFRGAVECAGWADEQGDELERRVAWEASAGPQID